MSIKPGRVPPRARSQEGDKPSPSGFTTAPSTPTLPLRQKKVVECYGSTGCMVSREFRDWAVGIDGDLGRGWGEGATSAQTPSGCQVPAGRKGKNWPCPKPNRQQHGRPGVGPGVRRRQAGPFLSLLRGVPLWGSLFRRVVWGPVRPSH